MENGAVKAVGRLPPMGKPIIIATVLLAVSLFLLCSKISKPSTIQIVVEGQSTKTEQIPNLYGPADVAWIVVFSMLTAASAAYILSQQSERATPVKDSQQKKRWKETLKRLQGADRTIYAYAIASEGVVFQSDIVKNTGLGKGTVSVALGRMSARDLLEKRRNGMMNIIILK